MLREQLGSIEINGPPYLIPGDSISQRLNSNILRRLSDRFFLSFASHTVKFDDCMGNEEVALESSDPVFSVRADGSVFAKASRASLLDVPAQFKVTARGPHTHVWQTVVQVALTEPPSSQVSQTHPREHTNHTFGVIYTEVRVAMYFDRLYYYDVFF